MHELVGRQNSNHSSYNLTCSIVVGAGMGLVGGRLELLRIFIVVQHMVSYVYIKTDNLPECF